MERKFLAVEKAWLSNPNLSLLEKLIVAQVQEYSRNRRECYMTDAQFADAFGVNVQQVTRAIKKLSDKGILIRNTKTVSNNGQASKTRTLQAIVKFDYSLDEGIVTSDNSLPEGIVTDDYSLEAIVKNDGRNSQNGTEGIVTSDYIKDNKKDNKKNNNIYKENYDYLFGDDMDNDYMQYIVDCWEANMDDMSIDCWSAESEADASFRDGDKVYSAAELKAIVDYYSL